MKYLYILVFAVISHTLLSQCEADFNAQLNGLTMQFANASTPDDLNYFHWDFGDGQVTGEENPTHTYDEVGSYDVTFIAGTQESCRDTIIQRIEICDLSFTHEFSPICIGYLNEVTLTISEPSGIVDSVDVYIDQIKLNDSPIGIVDGEAIYRAKIVGDGKVHNLQVLSTTSSYCKVITEVIPKNCGQSCQNSNLEVMPIGQELHVIEINNNGYSPAVTDIVLGDMIKFIWNTDNSTTTSVDTDMNDSWNTGLRDQGHEFLLSLKNPGSREFFNRDNIDQRGIINAVCPDNNSSIIRLTFQNTQVEEDGFYVAIDGFIMYDQVYAYDSTGVTSIDYILPGDNLFHKIEIIDIASSCRLRGSVTSINCGADYECRLNVTAIQETRCDNDSMDYKITINALSRLTEDLEVYRNGRFLADMKLDNREVSGTYRFRGDGILDTIVAYNNKNFTCFDTLIFNQNNCSDPCRLGPLAVYGGIGDTKVFSVSRTTEINEILFSEVGEDVIMQWPDDDMIGMKIFNRHGDEVYNSGLLQQGNVYSAPLLQTGKNKFIIYDDFDDNISEFTVFTAGTCPTNNLNLIYSFIDTNGYIDGYNIFIDGEKYNDDPVPYEVGGENYGEISIVGNNDIHTVEIRDTQTNGCTTSVDVFVPDCTPLDCGAEMVLTPLDSCYNGDRIWMEIEVTHPDPIGTSVDIMRNGLSLNDNLFLYDDEGKVTFGEYLPANGGDITYSYRDEFDISCKDEIVFTTPVCETKCTYSNLKVENVDAAYIINNPTTPQSYYGCTDSLSYIAVSFYEKYADNETYYIFIDERYIGDYTLEPGDGLNTVFIQLYGDLREHELTVQNTQVIDCFVSTTFNTPECFNPCEIELDEVISISCENEVATHGVVLDPRFNADQLFFELDGERIDFTRNEDTIFFDMKGDGLDHDIKIGSTKDRDSECYDEISFTADYCLDCFLFAESRIIEDCNEQDSMIYRISINENFEGRFKVDFRGGIFELSTDTDGYSFDITTLGNGSTQSIKLFSLEDQFCFSELSFNTNNCSPIICEPDFEYSFDGYRGTFTDMSVTSEDITQNRWEVDGFLTFNNLNEFSYTFDSIAIYEICRFITTDSCSNFICYDVALPDPCNPFMSDFEYELNQDTILLSSKVEGDYDRVSFDLGDGAVYESENLLHVYKENGMYEVCLTAMNMDNRCQDTYCEMINVMTTSNEDILAQKINIYPNPLQSNQLLNVTKESGIEITDIKLRTIEGKLISIDTRETNNRVEISRSSILRSGVYLLEVNTNEGVIFEKILIH